MAGRWQVLTLEDFLLIAERLTGITVAQLHQSFDAECDAALAPHRQAVALDPSAGEMLALLAIGILRTEPLPTESASNEAAFAAMDFFLYLNGCQWIAELDLGRVVDHLPDLLHHPRMLVPFSDYLNELIDCG